MKAKLINHSLRFIQAQLVVTLFSLPLLITWGLPISFLSPIGNLIFSPVLTLFLFISSLIFFTELLFIPNRFLIWLLEKLTTTWLKIMAIDPTPWMIGFTRPHPLLLALIPVVTIAILLRYKHQPIQISIAWLFGFFVLTCGYLTIIETPYQLTATIPCNNHHVTLIKQQEQIVVIDPGVIGQRASAWSWLEYTLLPELVKKTGATRIDHLIVLQPTERLFDGVAKLCATIHIGTIYYAAPTTELSESAQAAFNKLSTIAQEHNTTLHAISVTPHTIALGSTTLKLEPMNRTITLPHGTHAGIRVAITTPNGTTLIAPLKCQKFPTNPAKNNR